MFLGTEATMREAVSEHLKIVSFYEIQVNCSLESHKKKISVCLASGTNVSVLDT